jgi:hypothetical protein
MEHGSSEANPLTILPLLSCPLEPRRAFSPGVNEMVRRRVGFGSAVLHQEDHHTHIASIGIDLGKTTIHQVA